MKRLAGVCSPVAPVVVQPAALLPLTLARCRSVSAAASRRLLLSSEKWRELYFVKPAVLLQSGPNTWWKVGFISVAQSKFVRYWQYWRILPCLSRAEKYRPNGALLCRDQEGFYISVFCVPCRIWEHLLTSVILRLASTVHSRICLCNIREYNIFN